MGQVVRGICALCKKEAELQNSHIIPVLVTNRIKSNPNSRFRSLDNINRVLQNGETHYMLCHDCEERFSALESTFGRFFLDEYLRTETIPTVNDENRLKDYVLSVAWRVLWNDLYIMGSFFKESFRGEFEEFEQKLRDYLLNGENDSIFSWVVYERG